MAGFSLWPACCSPELVGFSLWPESSMIGDGCAVAIVLPDFLFDYRGVCAGKPLTHIGGVAQMVRATDS
jgi:hypothetical protein